jgi:uncharacterized protein
VSSRFDRLGPGPGPVIQGRSADGFVVDGVSYRAMLLTPERVVAWDPPALDALKAEDLASLLDLSPPPEFLILGTGARMAFAPRGLTSALEGRGIGVEAMDSRAAARTWGLMRAEQRWIVAAIMAV